MPILDQGYQHWDGRLAGHALRWLTITRQGVRAQLKNRWLITTLVGALAPALVLAAFLILWGLFEQKSAILTPILFLFQGLPEEIKAGPKAFRTTFWTLAYAQFFQVQLFFSFLLVMIVGPDLISQDLRFNALPLYLSRPLRRVDYFLGKFGVIAAFLLAVTLVPAVLAYLIGLAFSLDPAMLRDTWRVLAASVAISLIVTASTGLLMLAFSSLSRNSRYVTAMWVGVWMLGGAASDALRSAVGSEWAPLASYSADLVSVGDALFDTDAEWTRLTGLFRAGQDAVLNGPGGGSRGRPRMFPFPFGPRRPRIDPPPPPPDAPTPPGLENDSKSRRPDWRWSAAVLAGLGVASVVVLSTRVRSLDRLK
ncbi:ABC transporter permease [Paludisphaera mucosa]|uniref:ABC transporter permease subunit n=1 Tax=Paludisphaera mucosa TaxID=3030827 RepID=A0ABT6FHK9_9BACT|nr:ABC transporter permease subunit [Paludisphaera mucosa]MDG3007025.1 ABC transporter permease subunit [Paludisphaera mucosa]